LVIIDTSLLMAVGSGRPSFESLLEMIEGKPILIVPETVMSELEKLCSDSRFSISSKASLALAILEKARVPVYLLNTLRTGNADDDIYLIASNLKKLGFNLIVATVDRGLRQRIKTIGVPVVYLRRTESRFELS
ncbi:MAG: PIN domain-containing protein, partial [Desulfurococcales archaeon]|nr:PIN domain-containing protein [Desulfurococcales archaeon]